MNVATDETFNQVIQSSKLPVLVDFWAQWCGPCRMLMPTVEELSSEMSDKVLFLKVNVDDASETARSFNIMSIPTLILLKEGKVVSTLSGVKDKESLKNWIENSIV